MNAQTDLFGEEPQDAAIEDAIEGAGITLGEPLAMPCGYLDRTNTRCKRLAWRPVMMNGKQMHSHGRPMLHCEMACFTAFHGKPGDPLENRGDE
ncbi:MAG: hypothetical protein QHC67_17645 [Sphingobium sp.]|uniref:hypothetical protein n=1 Tax=Sphingobium sp. TaxID=1912891 RepID=UPI0029A999B1|nr:hypothetical protein [Sphingobium sp.]MDX3911611.1 hypothetical protein [Sphingobium sp.]